MLKYEHYRDEFKPISLLRYIKRIWLRPAFHVVCQHAGTHQVDIQFNYKPFKFNGLYFKGGVNANYPTITPEMRPHTVVDMRTGYYRFVEGFEYLSDARWHCFKLMLKSFSFVKEIL